ncbi:tetratricopeptide repeat protein [Methanobacterium sp.]|jgi:membrane protease YdiL (CAAX protease family)/prefoldin subunit 5|uniref:tetratricopeptide repeat protein n=1 Tax=Methanobacterium sp. TaxID=2164 RepID=UPI00315846A3
MDKMDAKMAFDLGNTSYAQGRLEEAISYYKKAVNLFKNTNDPRKEADALLGIGDSYISLNKPEDAQKYYNSSLNLYNAAEDIIGEGYALTGLGISFERYKDYEEARECYEKSIKKFQKAGDYKRAGMVSNLIANTFELQDAFEDAVMDYKRSLELFEKVKDREREARVKDAMKDIESKRYSVISSKKDIAALIVYFIAISAAEISVTYVNMQMGLVLEMIILFALLIHSSFHESYNFSTLLRSMMALPMIRIIGLSIPIMQIQPLYWFPIIAIPLFAASFTLIRAQKLTRKKIGLVLGNIPLQLTIALSGVLLGFTEYLILKPAPLISTLSVETVLFGAVILTISTGFAEELLFRGILQKNAENVFGKVFGLLYASILFTALHVGWQSGLDLAFVFSVALFYGYAFQKTRSLLGVTLSHGISNSFLFLIMPFIFPAVAPYLATVF